MMDDKTGWEIIWSGGEPLIPPRDSHPSEVWNTEVKRKYTWTGRHVKPKPQHGAEEQQETEND